MSRNSVVWNSKFFRAELYIVKAASVDVSNIFRARLTFCLFKLVGQQALAVKRCACLRIEYCSFL